MASNIDKIMTPFNVEDFPSEPVEPGMEGDEIDIIVVDEDGEQIFGEEVDVPPPFGANLAEYMDDDELVKVASELLEDFESDKASRGPWEKAYVKGVKLLGLEGYEERSDPWKGAAGVFHPILSEAVIRFQAESITETFPAKGPVLVNIIGKETPDRMKQAKRVQADMNYFTTEIMQEYRKEHERLLLNVGMSGSGFKKIYYDPALKRPVSLFVPADEFVVSYGATDLGNCPRYTHVLKMYKNDIIKKQAVGFYREIDLPDAPAVEYSEVEKARQQDSGYEAVMEKDDRYTVLEMHVDYDFPDFCDCDEDGEPTGIALPYVITIEKTSGEILSIYRNWREEDPTKQKEEFFITYEYVPGLGFYGVGLIHLLGSIAKSATSILRQLTDAGTLANLPGGLKSRGLRIKGDDSPIHPGEWRDVDVPSGSVRDNLLPLPYKEPSATLYQLLGYIVNEGRTVASIADMKISDMNNQAPVGTTLAIIERGMKVMSAVNARIHASMRKELRLLARLIKENSPPQYEYETEGESSRAQDYDERVDVLPVSNPNASTLAQRIMQYQAALQLSQTAPEIYDRRELHRQMVEVLGLANADKIVPLEADMKPKDAVTENMGILTGDPVKAFIHQDHQAHIAIHMAAAEDPKIMSVVQKSPQAQSIAAAMAAHVQEHIGFQYRYEIEKQLGVSLPSPEEELPPDVEVSMSKMIQDAAGKLLQKNKEDERNRKIAEEQGDPIVQIQKQEALVKAAEVQRKEQADRLRAITSILDNASKEKIEGMKLGVDLMKTKEKGDLQQRIKASELIENAMVEESRQQTEQRIKASELIADAMKNELDMTKIELSEPKENKTNTNEE